MKVKNNTELLYKPFNLQNHKDNFSYYCEVVIHPNGKIEYAVPSHERKLLKVYAKQNHLTEDQAFDKAVEWGADYIDRLMHETGCVFIWYGSLYNGTNLTKKQVKAINNLIKTGCISDKCLNDIIDYSPFNTRYERLIDARKHAGICH